MTPRGGRGMNTAIADGHDLGWKLPGSSAAGPARRCSTRTRRSVGRSADATSRCRWSRAAAARRRPARGPRTARRAAGPAGAACLAGVPMCRRDARRSTCSATGFALVAPAAVEAWRPGRDGARRSRSTVRLHATADPAFAAGASALRRGGAASSSGPTGSSPGDRRTGCRPTRRRWLALGRRWRSRSHRTAAVDRPDGGVMRQPWRHRLWTAIAFAELGLRGSRTWPLPDARSAGRQRHDEA